MVKRKKKAKTVRRRKVAKRKVARKTKRRRKPSASKMCKSCSGGENFL